MKKSGCLCARQFLFALRWSISERKIPYMPHPLSGAAFPSAVQPLFVQEPAGQVLLTSAIETDDSVELKKQLDKQNITSNMLLDLFEHACKKKCSPESKNVLVEFSTAPLFGNLQQTVLDIAVKYDDVALATQLLGKGADPERCKTRSSSDAMRSVLAYPRRRNKLYPQGVAPTGGTDLDRALWAGLHERDTAIAILKNERGSKTIPQTWRDAVKENRLDILRAILLLGHADQDRSFRLLKDENDKVTDADLLEVMKEISNFSPKRKTLEDFNVKATFTDTNGEIVCRHLSMYQQEVQTSSLAIKFDYAQFKDIETIAKYVKPDTEQKYMHLRAQATETHLIDNREFGPFLAKQFAAMDADDKTTRLILIESTDHAMNLGLRIKDKKGKKVYVAKFFDPNTTTSGIRHASASLKTFENQELEMYMTESDWIKDYYPEPKGFSMAYVRPAATERHATLSLSPQAVGNRMLTSCIDGKEVDATVVWYLLVHGFAGNLRQLKEEIASRPEAERIALLEAKRYSDDLPGLQLALGNRHIDAINAFGELLPLVSQEQRAKLLDAKKADGVSVMDVILHRVDDNAIDNTIEAYGKLLSLLPQKARYALLADKINGTALHQVLIVGNQKAVSRYIKITVSTLSKDERAALLKDIKKSQTAQKPGRLMRWINHDYHSPLNAVYKKFYADFEAMENALKE